MKMKELIPGTVYRLKDGKIVEYSRPSYSGKNAVVHPPGEPDMQSCMIAEAHEFDRLATQEEYEDEMNNFDPEECE